MDQQDEGRTLKTERRTELDGGLDQRAGVFTAPDRALSCTNFRFSERGSLTKRKGGSRLVTVNARSGLANLPAPTLTEIAGAGPLLAGTYLISYTLGTVLGTKIGVSASGTIIIAVGSSIRVDIPPVNSGDGVGLSAPADDPFQGGYKDNTSTDVELYMSKSPDSPTKQGSFTGFTWDGTTRMQTFTIAAYSTNGAVATSINQPIPMRAIFWHPGLDATLGFIGELGVHFSGAHTTATFLGRATDSAGNLYAFSRLPTRMSFTISNNVAIVSDGVGMPKKLNTPTLADPTTWDWREVGAGPPAIPTQANNGAGGLNGTYMYVITFTYRHTRADGTTYDIESNASPAVTATPANNVVRITRSAALASGIVAWTVYRTVVTSSTPFFLVSAATIAIATTTFDDNIADGNLNTAVTPPLPLDPKDHSVPPNGLHFITEHASVLFGVQRTFVSDGTNRIVRLRMTNVVQWSLLSTVDRIGGPVDCWPVLFSVVCGAFAPITALKSFNGLLYVFKQEEIGVITGTYPDFAYRTIWTNSGAMENSVIAADDSLYCFDQARTALRISGYSVQDVGIETIQTGWTDISFATGIAVSPNFRDGGGRALSSGQGMAVINAIYDSVESEIRWTMSDFCLDRSIVASPTYIPYFYEYVMSMLPGSPVRFSVFTGAQTGVLQTSDYDRRITGACRAVVGSNVIYQARDVLYCDYQGRLVLDNQVEGDLNNTVAITLRAIWPLFLGDNPEMVKLFRYLYVLLTTGATAGDALTFKTSSLAKQTGAGVPKTMLLVNGGSTENRMIRMGPIVPIDTVNTAERGLLLTLDATAISGPLRIRELALKYGDLSDERSAP